MKFQGFIGGAYNLPNVNVDAQRLVNLYAEVIESGSGKESQIAYLMDTPGLTKLFTVGSGKLRLIHFDGLQKNDGVYFQKNRVFIVSGPDVYRFEYSDTSGWSRLLLGSIATKTGPVSAASADQQYGATVFVDGGAENYVYLKTAADVETFRTFTAAGYVPVARASQVVWIDGYFIFMIADSNQFYVSEWGKLTVAALSFASAEGDPDNIMAIISLNRTLWLLNERSIELFYNSGNSDLPFERINSGFIENGCLAAFSVAKIAGVVIWLGRDENGQGIVNASSGGQATRVSTHAIEKEIAKYASPKDATAFTYQSGGHNFYQISFAEGTWVYDITTKLWHQRAFLSDGQLKRHRVDTHAFFPNLNLHLVGDFENSNLYYFDDTKKTDDGAAIKRLRSSPHVSKNGAMLFYDEFKLDIKTGVGLDGAETVQGHNPQMMLRYSDDGGHTWSNEKWVSMGKLAKRLTRVIWRRLGKSRDRVFEISHTEPVETVLMGAELEVTAGKY